ncbi:DUF401 family protein [Desulfohalobium retbaense]|uniref:DUF401 family protein n=1 Tax=Desulfohalobium retbaense (strain ATCC 49708 / DSM 5692 / JCM 16813 / HR100) TaxID=485915 RepID=C8X4P0_DESRD|nr:DUF401 family protein [Desulfohalobium retbaense]ACV69263.1 protein of unknown function DUF401 [Desulfohalobium retbaense DSM 5692]
MASVALGKIALVFGAMLFGLRLRCDLGLTILGGSLLLGLLFGLDLLAWSRAALAVGTESKLMSLCLVVALILIFSRVLEQTGQSRRLMDALLGVLRWPRLRLVFFPALIGLLPMPGGAVFSAPMVRQAGQDAQVPDRDKAILNYWFRHIWELSWPLYPGIIMAAYLAHWPLTRLISLTWPSVLLCLALGWFFFLRPGVLALPAHNGGEESYPPLRWSLIIAEGAPLAITLAGALGLEAVIRHAGWTLDPEWGFVVALVLGIAWSGVQNRFAPRRLLRLVFSGHVGKMVLLVVAVFVFKNVLERAGVVQSLSGGAAQTAFGVAVVLLPFLVGLLSGITVAFVGATFPLLLSLMEQSLSGQAQTALLMLALFAGFTGVLLSPLHACLLLSCEFFETGLGHVWKRLVPPAVLFFLAGAGYCAVLYLVGG